MTEDVIKPLHELLESVSRRDIDETPAEKKLRELKSLPDDDKYAKVFELKMRGVPASSISRIFDVDTSTVHRWLRQYAESYRTRIEQEPAANIIAESMQFLNAIEELCLYEVDQITTEETRTDPKTGEVLRVTSVQSNGVKVKYIQSVLKARQMMLDLLVQTGVLPRESSDMYKRMEAEKKIDETDLSKVADATSREELERRLVEALSKDMKL
jgi:transposase-like protein